MLNNIRFLLLYSKVLPHKILIMWFNGIIMPLHIIIMPLNHCCNTPHAQSTAHFAPLTVGGRAEMVRGVDFLFMGAGGRWPLTPDRMRNCIFHVLLMPLNHCCNTPHPQSIAHFAPLKLPPPSHSPVKLCTALAATKE